MHLIDEFGYWTFGTSIDFDLYKLQVIPKFDQQINIIDKLSNMDGFYYPPIQKTYKYDPKTKKKVGKAKPKTKRPAQIHRVAVTHQVLCNNQESQEVFREKEGHFILSLIGYLYDTRLQYWNWWWEGKINVKQKPIIQFEDSILSKILTNGLLAWRKLSAEQQKIFLNAMFFFQRGKTLEWHYEKFIHYYVALDAIWSFGKTIFNPNSRKISHKDRIIRICKDLNICYDFCAVDLVYNARNLLIHEGQFGVLNPTSRVLSDRYRITQNLELLIERMLIASLGFQPAFLQTPWWETRTWQMWE